MSILNTLDDLQKRAVLAKSPTLINAAAGSGKTRCLIAKIIHLTEQGVPPGQICAITFTNKAANEMKERLRGKISLEGMQVSTIHSLCVRIMKTFIKYTHLRLPFSIYDDNDQLSVIKTILKAKDINEDPKEILMDISRAKTALATEELEDDLELVYKRYQEILFKNNACDFDDLLINAYYCLRNKDCSNYYSDLWPHILVDEFQDTSVIQYNIVDLMHDRDKSQTLFVVGDYNQCVTEDTIIYDTPVNQLTDGDVTTVAIGNNRTSNLFIENIYKKYVENKPVITIVTESGKRLTTTYEHTHFAGFHPDYPSEKYFTYLMYKEEMGYRIGVTSMTRSIGNKGTMLGFKMRLGQERADYMWLLGSYNTKAEAKYYEQYYAIVYGIPLWIFFTKGRGVKLDYDDHYIKKLFKEINTKKAAEHLLNDLGLFIEKPHHIPKCMNIKRRRNFSIRLCGQTNSPTRFYHKYALSGSDINDKELLIAHGFNVRKAKDRRGYRIEGVSTDLSEINELFNKINKVLPLNRIESAKFTNISLPMIPASHILPGMVCFVEKNGKIENEIIVSAEKSTHTGYVHDLNINKAHNYIANGIVTHNSIYGWRDANPENIQNFIKKYKPSVCFLRYNYRSSQLIIQHANNWVQFGKPMIAKLTHPGRVSFTEFYDHEEEATKIAMAIQKIGDYENTAVISRINARSLIFERVFSQHRIPYKVLGALPYYKRKVSKDLLSYCKASLNRSDLESLIRIVNVPKRGFGPKKKEQLLLRGWPYLLEMAQEMKQIDVLVTLLDNIKDMEPLDAIEEILAYTGYREQLKKDNDLNMVNSFLDVTAGFDSLDELILASTFLEDDSGRGVKLLTAHSSKGLEFDNVFVVGVENGLWPHSRSEDIKEEARLFYVACTRAKKILNVSYSRTRLLRGSRIDVNPSDLFLDSYKNSMA